MGPIITVLNIDNLPRTQNKEHELNVDMFLNRKNMQQILETCHHLAHALHIFSKTRLILNCK